MKCEHWSMNIESNCHKNESLIKYCQISLHAALRCSQHECVESILFFSPSLSLSDLPKLVNFSNYFSCACCKSFYSAEPPAFTNWEVVSLSYNMVPQCLYKHSADLFFSTWVIGLDMEVLRSTLRPIFFLFFYVMFNMQGLFWNSPGHH